MSAASITVPGVVDELENDLASVAAQAALELDHLSLGRPIGFSGTQRLIELIGTNLPEVAEPVAPNSLFSPATAVALGKAFDEALGQAPTTRVAELVPQAASFKARLAAVVAKPTEVPKAEQEALRNVCVALSRQATAMESASRYRREHPFKKYL
jgi:hypothetical protein